MTRPGLSKWANLFVEEMWKRGWDLAEIGPDGIWMQHGRGGELVDFTACRQSGIAIGSRGQLAQQWGETVREAAEQMLNSYPDCDYVFGAASELDDMYTRIEDVFFAARELRGLQNDGGASPETDEPWSDVPRWFRDGAEVEWAMIERIKDAFENAGWTVRPEHDRGRVVALVAFTPSDAPRHVHVDLSGWHNDWHVTIDHDTTYGDPCPVRALRLAYDDEDSRGVRAALAPALDALDRAEDAAGSAEDALPTDPTYYRAPSGTLTAADVIDSWGLDYWSGSVVAHVLRAGCKPGETKLEALRNAAGCLAHAIRVEEGGE